MSKSKRLQSLSAAHELKFGLRPCSIPTEADPAPGALCMFCVAFGREEKPGRKRKASSTTKMFKAPFRTDNFTAHMKGCHPQKWDEYCSGNADVKAAFFAGYEKEVPPVPAGLFDTAKENKMPPAVLNPAHELKFGVRPCTIGSNKTAGAECRFCSNFGREEKANRKRKSSGNVKVFKPPFRTDNFGAHMKNCHPLKWAEYVSASDTEKIDFFPDQLHPRPQAGVHGAMSFSADATEYPWMPELHQAAEAGDLQRCQAIVRRVGRQQVLAGMTDGSLATPLHRAAKSGHVHICQLFLELTPSAINAQDAIGYTPLHWAAAEGHAQVCSLLLRNSAADQIQNSFGETALEVAKRMNKRDVIVALNEMALPSSADAPLSLAPTMTFATPNSSPTASIESSPKKPPATSTRHGIAQYLANLELSEYLACFEREAITVDLLGELNEQDLIAIGVDKLGHRKKMLLAIRGN